MMFAEPKGSALSSTPDTRFFRVSSLRRRTMINRYLFEVIFSAVTLCGVIVGWELFLAGSFL